MILCITPNANIERVWLVAGLRVGEAQRARQVLELPSGKGNNVARAIRTLGGQPTCSGFTGGPTGQRIIELMRDLDIPCRWTPIAPESRTSIVLVDTQHPARDVTTISEIGPTVTLDDWQRLHDDALRLASGARLACICGSMPPGTPMGEITRLVGSLGERGLSVWVDCEGDAARAGLAGRPAGIKINAREAAGVLGRPVEGVEGALAAARDLRAMGAGTAIITLGKAGAVMVCEQGAWHGKSGPIEAISTVGSGDSFLAAWLCALSPGLTPSEALGHGLAAGAANALTLGAGQFERRDFEACLREVAVLEIGR